jgi:hypothetical protein
MRVMSWPSKVMRPERARRRAANGHHQGGFAGAVRTDERCNLAFIHIEVDPLQSLDFAVEGFDTAHRKKAAHRRPRLVGVEDLFAGFGFFAMGALATAATARSTTTSASPSSSTPR